MHFFISCLLYLLCSQVVTNAYALKISELEQDSVNITRDFSFLVTDSEIDPQTDTTPLENAKKIDRPEFIHSYTAKSIWIIGKIKNDTQKNVEKFIVFDTTLSGHLFYYEKEGSNPFVLKEMGGSSVPKTLQKIKSLKPAYLLSLGPNEEKTILIKRTSVHQLDAKIYLKSYENFINDDFDQKILLTFYSGMVVALFLYNLFLFFHSRSKDYLRYCFFIACISLTVLNISGGLDLYLFYNHHTASRYLIIFSSVSIISTLYFSYYFLKLQLLHKVWTWLYLSMGVLAIIHTFLRLMPVTSQVHAFIGISIDTTILFTIIMVIISGFNSLKNGHIIAKYFLFSWTFFFLGVLVWLGIFYGPIPKNIVTTNAVLIGNIFEMLFIAFALSFKLNILERQKREAEIQARDKEKYQRLVRVLCHDIANSLFIIQGFTKIARRRPEVVNESKTWQKIQKASENMANILKAVRLQESANSQDSELNLHPVCLNDTIKESYFYFKDKCLSKELQFSFDLEENIPLIQSDKTTLLNNVLNNVFSNAIKFSNKQSMIQVKTYQNDQSIYCEIKDQGIGIPADKIRSLIKGQFIRSTKGTQGEDGTGHGLILIKNYMNLFGGEFEIKSSTIEDNRGKTGTKIILKFALADTKFPIEKNSEGP